MAKMPRTADAMRSLNHVAALTDLPEIGDKISKAEEAPRRGGVLQPFPDDFATTERVDLDRHFSGWMAEAEGNIRQMIDDASQAGLRTVVVAPNPTKSIDLLPAKAVRLWLLWLVTLGRWGAQAWQSSTNR